MSIFETISLNSALLKLNTTNIPIVTIPHIVIFIIIPIGSISDSPIKLFKEKLARILATHTQIRKV